MATSGLSPYQQTLSIHYHLKGVNNMTHQMPLWDTPEWTVKTAEIHYQESLEVEDTSLSHYRAVAAPHISECRRLIAVANWKAYCLGHDIVD